MAGSTSEVKERECTRMQRNQWRTQGVRGVGSNPRTGKNCCREILVFTEALFLATKFPQNR